MAVKSIPLRLAMAGDTQVENVTLRVQQALQATGLAAGVLVLFMQHTTASVLIIEDEPGLRADTQAIWERLVPADPSWQHNTRNPGEDNAHSHLRAQLQGSSVTIPFNDGRLALGTWQQIVVIDFDTRARTREMLIQVIGE
jgi:secondary thiamine-phosphate synthase enzyme